MKNIEEQMSFYAAYHQDARNKATHFIGVPAIILALFIPLAWIRFEAGGAAITGAMIFAGAVVLYYFFLDVPLALAMLAVTAVSLCSLPGANHILYQNSSNISVPKVAWELFKSHPLP